MKKLGKPESSSDVVNSEPKVLLIGYGWLGQYYHKYFTQADITTSDGYQKKNYDHYDLAIIGVPTPMNQETGQCDTSIVENCVEKYKDVVDIFLIKSTVEIGTTDRIAKEQNVKIAMSAEFLGETLGHPLVEPKRDNFLIIGGEDETANKIAGYFHKVLNANAPLFICSAKEAEIIKYAENMWITQRVAYWQDVYEITQTFGVSFDRVREGIVLDPRMSRTHSFVYPDNRGFSGHCLPKDMSALTYIMRKKGKPLPIIEFLLDHNASYWRKDYNNNTQLLPNKPLWKKNEKNTSKSK